MEKIIVVFEEDGRMYEQTLPAVEKNKEINPSAREGRWHNALDRAGIHTGFPGNIMTRADKSNKIIDGGLYPCPHCGKWDLVVKHPCTGALYSDCRCDYGHKRPARSSILGTIREAG